MRILFIVVATLTGFASGSARAQNHLPEPCAQLDFPPPPAYYCPTSYVELTPERDDTVFARAFLCRETNMALGATHNGGCGSLGILDGWSVPRESLPDRTQTEPTYLDLTFVLFDDFLRMQRDGVFLHPEEIERYTSIGIVLPDDFRGSHRPGGFFARPPGSDWKVQLEQLDRVFDNDQEKCVVIPRNAETDTMVCGGELALLIPAVVFDPSSVERITNRMWLAKICYESPVACPLVAEY